MHNISITDIFWIESDRNKTCFSLKGFPNDIHFVISHHQDEVYGNIYVSKTVDTKDTKLKIRIIQFKKSAFLEVEPLLAFIVFNTLLRPLSLKNYTPSIRKRIKILFLEDFESNGFNKGVEEKIDQIFTHNSNPPFKKVMFDGCFFKGLTTIFNSKNYEKFYNSDLQAVTDNTFALEASKIGVLFYGKSIIPFIGYKGNGYAINQDASLIDLLICFMSPSLAQNVLEKTFQAIEQIQKANTRADTQPYDNPIPIFIDG